MKLQKKCVILVKTLHDYHSTADLDYIIVQLKRVKPSSQILALIKHVISDRNWLADNRFNTTSDVFINGLSLIHSRRCHVV